MRGGSLFSEGPIRTSVEPDSCAAFTCKSQSLNFKLTVKKCPFNVKKVKFFLVINDVDLFIMLLLVIHSRSTPGPYTKQLTSIN